MGSVQCLKPALGPTFTDDPPCAHWIREPFELESGKVNQLEQVADQAAGALSDDDGAGFGGLLEAGCKIGRLPGDRLLF